MRRDYSVDSQFSFLWFLDAQAIADGYRCALELVTTYIATRPPTSAKCAPGAPPHAAFEGISMRRLETSGIVVEST